MTLYLKKGMTIEKLLIGGFTLSLLVTFCYAYNFLGYVILSLSLMFSAHYLFLTRYYIVDRISRVILLFLLITSIVGGIVNSNLKSTFMINTSLLLPFALSTLDINTQGLRKAYTVTSVLALLVVYFQVNMEILGHLNSNTQSFLAYMGISVGFIWFKDADKKIYPIAYIILGYLLLLQTGSRNVGVVILLCMILLLLPEKVLTNKNFYRVLYGAILFYVIFAPYFMQIGFANSEVKRWLDEYTASFSNKAWEMEGRTDFLFYVLKKISAMHPLEKIFGKGVLPFHGHNLFYQCVGMYGYAGAIGVFGIFVRVFEMARTLLVKKNDNLILGCIVVLLGHLMIQGADVYMFGSETCVVMPLVTIGVVLNRYRKYQEEQNQL